MIASVFVLLTCVSFASSVCSGWRASGMARMACCADEEQPCTQVSAETCCGTAEQQQYATVSPTPLAPHSPLALFVFAPLITSGPDRDVGSFAVAAPRVLGSPPPAHLLFSVFLI